LAVTAHDSILVTTGRLDSVVVTRPNTAPVLATNADLTIAEGMTLSVTNTATDADAPKNTLSFGLVAPPAGMTIDAASGVVAWTPDETQGPSTNVVTVVVSDDGTPLLSVTNSFTVLVTEVNEPPVLATNADFTIAEGMTLSVTNTATDADVPTNTLTFGLVAPPAGMTIDAASGVIAWTPDETKGPSTNVVTVVVSDDGTPSLSVTNNFTVLVTEVNEPPVLAAIALTNGEVVLSWNAVTGRTYRLEWSPDAARSADWTNALGDFLATNPVVITTDALTNGAQRFYRVHRLP
jgi:hypothetical protein